jgi:hypothetical protein
VLHRQPDLKRLKNLFIERIRVRHFRQDPLFISEMQCRNARYSPGLF